MQLVYLQSTDGKSWGSWGKKQMFQLHDTILTIIKQLFLTLVPIVWLVAIQTRSVETKMGMNWSLCEYSTSNWCLHCLIGACDKRENEWSHCPLYPYKNQAYLRFACYGWCLPYLQQKIRVSIPVWGWHGKKTQTWHQSWYTASRGFMMRYDV